MADPRVQIAMQDLAIKKQEADRKVMDSQARADHRNRQLEMQEQKEAADAQIDIAKLELEKAKAESDIQLDVVICSEVLEHLEDYNKAIQEIHRVLKPGGYFLVSVPSFLPEKICWMLSKEYQNMPGGHVRIFKKSNILKVMQDHKFSLIQSEKYHAFHSAYWWLRCIFWKTQENNFLVKVYKKILERHILKNTPIMDVIEKLLNPILGKSISFYFKKN